MKRLSRKDRTSEKSEPELPAVPSGGILATLGAYKQNEAIVYEDEKPRGEFRFLRFYSKKANNAIDVVTSFGSGTQEGHPYLSSKDYLIDVAGAPFAIVAEFPHWITTSPTDFAPDRAWLDPQPWGKSVGDARVKEGFLALVLFFLEDGAVMALAEARGTKAPFVKDYLKAVDKSTTPEGAKALGHLASAVPPRFRVVGTLRMVAKSGKFPYALAHADTRPIALKEIETLQRWAADEEAQADREALESLYEKKVDEIKDLAKATRD